MLWSTEEIKAVLRGMHIEAIRLYRARLNTELREAKDAIEGLGLLLGQRVTETCWTCDGKGSISHWLDPGKTTAGLSWAKMEGEEE